VCAEWKALYDMSAALVTVAPAAVIAATAAVQQRNLVDTSPHELQHLLLNARVVQRVQGVSDSAFGSASGHHTVVVAAAAAVDAVANATTQTTH
jgi:hypothetical protein